MLLDLTADRRLAQALHSAVMLATASKPSKAERTAIIKDLARKHQFDEIERTFGAVARGERHPLAFMPWPMSAPAPHQLPARTITLRDAQGQRTAMKPSNGVPSKQPS